MTTQTQVPVASSTYYRLPDADEISALGVMLAHVSSELDIFQATLERWLEEELERRKMTDEEAGRMLMFTIDLERFGGQLARQARELTQVTLSVRQESAPPTDAAYYENTAAYFEQLARVDREAAAHRRGEKNGGVA